MGDDYIELRRQRAIALWDSLSQDENYGDYDDNQLKALILERVRAEIPAPDATTGAVRGGPESLRQVQPSSPEQADRIQRILRNQAQAEIAGNRPESALMSGARGLARGTLALPTAIANTTGLGDEAMNRWNESLRGENENPYAAMTGELAGEFSGYGLGQMGASKLVGAGLSKLPGAQRLGHAVASRFANSPGMSAALRAVPEEIGGAAALQGVASGPDSFGANPETLLNLGMGSIGVLGRGLQGRNMDVLGALRHGESRTITDIGPATQLDGALDVPTYLRRPGGMPEPQAPTMQTPDIAQIVAERQALAALDPAAGRPTGQGVPPMNVRPDLTSLFQKNLGTRMAEGATPNAAVGDMPPVPGGANLLYGLDAATDNSLRNMAHNMRSTGPSTPASPGAPVQPTPNLGAAFDPAVSTTTGGAKTPPSPRKVKVQPKAAPVPEPVVEAPPAPEAPAEGADVLGGIVKPKPTTSGRAAPASGVSPKMTFEQALEKVTLRKPVKKVKDVWTDSMGRSFSPEDVARAEELMKGGAAPKGRNFRPKPKS